MTETEARQTVLLLAHDRAAAAGMASAAWSRDDGQWATMQAVATVGEKATPEGFLRARTVAGLARLLPRDPAAAAWLALRLWSRAWIVGAVGLGLVAGLAIDQLGAPQRVNLLAPAVWAVVAWNLVVCMAAVVLAPGGVDPGRAKGLRATLARWLMGRRAAEGPSALADAERLWWPYAAPLGAQRAALVLHLAAAALAAGLIAGLYLRGLVLDYRAGWQSTFADAATVQSALDVLLAPAAAISGVAVPDVAPLRLGPDVDATASAAPWIHLYATTLLLAVVLPRLLLAGLAARRAWREARDFALPLDLPDLAGLHPAMRPGQVPSVRLLWLGDRPAGLALFEQAIHELPHDVRPLTLLQDDQGERLDLYRLPDGWQPDATSATPATVGPAPGWQRWLRRWPSAQPPTALERLRGDIDAVLLHAPTGAARPAWLAALGRPTIWLRTDVDDGGAAAPAGAESASALPLHRRHDGWLAEGRLLAALADALPGDTRLVRLCAAWHRQQRSRLHAIAAAAADVLARVAWARETLPDDSGLLSRRSDAEAARQALVARFERDVQALDAMLDAQGGRRIQARLHTALPASSAALHARVGEGRAALVGGALGGALLGLKADLATGGLSMGAGALTGGIVGALGAAGAARGLNIVRGTGRSYVAWDEAALFAMSEAVLERCLVLGFEAGQTGPADATRARLATALAAQHGTLQTLWRSRVSAATPDPSPDGSPDASPEPGPAVSALATSLASPLAAALHQTLGGPPLDDPVLGAR